jgi:hypothetical protein
VKAKEEPKKFDWSKEKMNFRVINHRRRESKGIMHVSNVFGKNKLHPEKLFETTREFKTHRP